MTAIMFIDANIYLDFYQLRLGKPLLDFIEEQREHIFVSKQIVHEVERNKLSKTNDYFKSVFAPRTVIVSVGNKNLTYKYPEYMNVPDHLFGIPDEKVHEIRKAVHTAKNAMKELQNLSGQIVQQIARSEDYVSKRLQQVFSIAAQATTEQMKRARERKELGSPPGKKSDPLGDQISWEQFLCRCHEGSINRVWIVSKDKDYLTPCIDGSLVLNVTLQPELRAVEVSEFFCFDNLLDASNHFRTNAGVQAQAGPSAEEEKEIRKEIKTFTAGLYTPPSSRVVSVQSFLAGSPFLTGGSPFVISETLDPNTGKED